MPPPHLFGLEGIDLDRSLLTRQQIYELLPHRHEFMLLDGICHVDRDRRHIVGFRDIREDDWCFRGHIPGRPLLPGVLMLEMAAQAVAVLAKLIDPSRGFIGYGGVDGCKFRETIIPPARLYVLGLGIEDRPRRIVSDTQGVRAGKLVFEARVTGLPLGDL